MNVTTSVTLGIMAYLGLLYQELIRSKQLTVREKLPPVAGGDGDRIGRLWG